jgi:hypothetical protein
MDGLIFVNTIQQLLVLFLGGARRNGWILVFLQINKLGVANNRPLKKDVYCLLEWTNSLSLASCTC